MIRLEESCFPALCERYAAESLSFSLTRAVLEGRQPGIAHGDRKQDPAVVLVVNRFGFAHAFGAVDDATLQDALLASLSSDPDLRGRYLLWYDPPARCAAGMDALSDSVARVRTRVLYHFREGRFRETDPAFRAPPAGAEVVHVELRALTELEPFGLDLGSRFWPSDETFVASALPVVLRVDGRPASVCYAAAIAGGVAEVDVATLEDFRGRGLARAAVGAFLDRCLACGVTPNWDCFDYNEASCRLAVSLGFEERLRYPFYSVNT